MKKIILLLIVPVLFFQLGCKCKQKKNDATITTEKTTKSQAEKVSGKVSYEYKADGCTNAVIVVELENKEQLILIAKDPLPKEFDVDGLMITFNYRTLKMKNPPGCKGIPAEITNISKSN